LSCSPANFNVDLRVVLMLWNSHEGTARGFMGVRRSRRGGLVRNGRERQDGRLVRCRGGEGGLSHYANNPCFQHQVLSCGGYNALISPTPAHSLSPCHPTNQPAYQPLSTHLPFLPRSLFLSLPHSTPTTCAFLVHTHSCFLHAHTLLPHPLLLLPPHSGQTFATVVTQAVLAERVARHLQAKVRQDRDMKVLGISGVVDSL
jgi:hypothetical protein